jgi:hypothetical protein
VCVCVRACARARVCVCVCVCVGGGTHTVVKTNRLGSARHVAEVRKTKIRAVRKSGNLLERGHLESRSRGEE